MKIKIRDNDESEEVTEFWLEQEGEDIIVKSNGRYHLTEFRIRPNESWRKCTDGFLDDKETK